MSQNLYIFISTPVFPGHLWEQVLTAFRAESLNLTKADRANNRLAQWRVQPDERGRIYIALYDKRKSRYQKPAGDSYELFFDWRSLTLRTDTTVYSMVCYAFEFLPQVTVFDPGPALWFTEPEAVREYFISRVGIESLAREDLLGSDGNIIL